MKLIDYQSSLDSLFYSSSNTNNFFILTRQKIVGKVLKNNYIIACKNLKESRKIRMKGKIAIGSKSISYEVV